MSTTRILSALFLVGGLCLVVGMTRAESADALIAKGDVFDKQLQAAEALDNYLPAEKLDPDNAQLLVRIARQYRHLMSDASSKSEKLRLGHISLEYAQRAATLAPNNSEAQLSPAISYGKMLPYMGSKEQVDASPRIKQSVDRALELDPKNDTAWHILGHRHDALMVATFGQLVEVTARGRLDGHADAPRLIEHLCQRRILRPLRHDNAVDAPARAQRLKHRLHQIELGRIYAAMGRKEDARKFIEKGLAMPNKEKDDPEMKAIGQALLKKLG